MRRTNHILSIPFRSLFVCHGLKKLGLSDNELTCIPPALASLVGLTDLDCSKNGILDIPGRRRLEVEIGP